MSAIVKRRGSNVTLSGVINVRVARMPMIMLASICISGDLHNTGRDARKYALSDLIVSVVKRKATQGPSMLPVE